MYVEELRDDDEVTEVTNEENSEIKVEETEELKVEENLEVGLEEELDTIKDQFIRLQADFKNFRRRSENERHEYVSLGVKKIAADLVTVVDNFDRALESYDDKECSFYKGIEMIKTQLKDILEKNGVVEINAINEKFDPNFHHAVLIEDKEGVEPGVVIEELQKGYMIKDKVLRPSMVKVSE